jgi:hypothetical protein
MPARPLALLVLTLGAASCAATTLRARRDEPPRLTLPTALVSLAVQDCPEREALARLLPQAIDATGTYSVVDCQPGSPCSAGATVQAIVSDHLVEPRGLPSDLNLEALAQAATEVKVTARVTVTAFDLQGQKLFGRVYSGWKVGSALKTSDESLFLEALQYALSGLTADLGSRELRLELKLETGGDLDEGVDRALAGDLPGARASLAALTTARPDFAAAWYDLGVVHEVGGDDQQALACYRTAAHLSDAWLYRHAQEQLEARLRP